MSTATNTIEELANREYEHGFITDIEADTVPPGLNEDIVRLISAKKNEPAWLLEWRLKAYRHWLTHGGAALVAQRARTPPIDYQDVDLLLGPQSRRRQLTSLDEVDPEVRKTFEKLGISLDEQKRLSGVAVDAVFDSVSVATTFKGKLAEMGIIFCSFSEAVHEHPELVRKYLGSRGAVQRQLLRRPQLGGLQRRLVLLHPQGRALPDGAVHLLPHQRRRTPASSSGR